MKKTLMTAFTIVLISIGGVVTYLNYETSAVPSFPAVGIVVTPTATIDQVSSVLSQVKSQRVYIAYTKQSSQEVQNAVGAYESVTNTFFQRDISDEELLTILTKIVGSHEKDGDFVIIKL